jgi:hypothetical protein
VASPKEVIERHIRAVASADPVSMAADYADDATLSRPGQTLRGHKELLAYFETVPSRLGGRRVEQRVVRVEGGTVRVRWQIAGGPRGTDTYQVVQGRIVSQEVKLEGSDF